MGHTGTAAVATTPELSSPESSVRCFTIRLERKEFSFASGRISLRETPHSSDRSSATHFRSLFGRSRRLTLRVLS
jgi:hypothetical protein